MPLQAQQHWCMASTRAVPPTRRPPPAHSQSRRLRRRRSTWPRRSSRRRRPSHICTPVAGKAALVTGPGVPCHVHLTTTGKRVEVLLWTALGNGGQDSAAQADLEDAGSGGGQRGMLVLAQQLLQDGAGGHEHVLRPAGQGPGQVGATPGPGLPAPRVHCCLPVLALSTTAPPCRPAGIGALPPEQVAGWLAGWLAHLRVAEHLQTLAERHDAVGRLQHGRHQLTPPARAAAGATPCPCLAAAAIMVP